MKSPRLWKAEHKYRRDPQSKIVRDKRRALKLFCATLGNPLKAWATFYDGARFTLHKPIGEAATKDDANQEAPNPTNTKTASATGAEGE